MARRRYRRYYRRKGKWSSNIFNFVTNLTEDTPLPANSSWSRTATLCTNPAQTASLVSERFTIKNIETTFVVEAQDGSASTINLESITAYVMYVPQGMNVGDDYHLQHPEYILNYKFLGSPSPDTLQQFQPIRIKSRLARRLDTGDSIILYLFGVNESSSTYSGSIKLQGVARWWTKST